jgi:hypothetical protein
MNFKNVRSLLENALKTVYPFQISFESKYNSSIKTRAEAFKLNFVENNQLKELVAASNYKLERISIKLQEKDKIIQDALIKKETSDFRLRKVLSEVIYLFFEVLARSSQRIIEADRGVQKE